jgi:hypothetical protein
VACALYIWIRRTVDWADDEAALDQITDPWLKPKIQLWNGTFNISYQRFRHRIAQIAELNHSKVAGAMRADWDEIPDGALVLPVDDDDWVAPGAAGVLEQELDPRMVGYLWPSRWIEVPVNLGHRLHLIRRGLLPRTPPKWICAANNYAMVKSPETKPLLASHVRASRWVEPRVRAGDGTIKEVAAELSLANRTLASLTSLRGPEPARRQPTMSRSRLMRKYRTYRRLYDDPPSGGLAWCRPYVQMMSDLMAELEVAERS